MKLSKASAVKRSRPDDEDADTHESNVDESRVKARTRGGVVRVDEQTEARNLTSNRAENDPLVVDTSGIPPANDLTPSASTDMQAQSQRGSLEVVLREPVTRQVVLWDRDRRIAQTASWNRSQPASPARPANVCPYCSRPMPEGADFNEDQGAQYRYIAPHYFRLLSSQHENSLGPAGRAESTWLLPAPERADNSEQHRRPQHRIVQLKENSGQQGSERSNSPAIPPDAGRRDEDAEVKRAVEDAGIGYYQRFFQQVRRIGTGAYGSVFEVRHMLDGVYLGTYAVKIAPVGDNREWLRKVLREVDNLQCLQHRNVVRYQHSWLEPHQMSPFTPLVPCLFILMQYADGGNLHALLGLDLRAGRRSVLGEEAVVEHLADVCCGLQYLHAMGIVHRDLKPENILVQTLDNPDAPHQPRLNLLITDLGQSRRLSELQGADRRSGCTGTVRFTAPEMLEELCPDGEVGGGAFSVRRRYSHDWTTKADVWSLGAVLFCLAYAALPFEHEEDLYRVAAAILQSPSIPRPPGPQLLPRSPELLALLDATLQHDPAGRPEVAQLLASPLLRLVAARRSNANPLSPRMSPHPQPHSHSHSHSHSLHPPPAPHSFPSSSPLPHPHPMPAYYVRRLPSLPAP